MTTIIAVMLTLVTASVLIGLASAVIRHKNQHRIPGAWKFSEFLKEEMKEVAQGLAFMFACCFFVGIIFAFWAWVLGGVQ